MQGSDIKYRDRKPYIIYRILDPTTMVVITPRRSDADDGSEAAAEQKKRKLPDRDIDRPGRTQEQPKNESKDEEE